jgi:pimeloyl-ACP methyl ester carboxylesterase
MVFGMSLATYTLRHTLISLVGIATGLVVLFGLLTGKRMDRWTAETDLTEDLKKMDVPTLILHGDDDQIVPIQASAMLSSKIVKDATLKIYKGASHGMCTTHKDKVNMDLRSSSSPKVKSRLEVALLDV